MAGYSIEMPDFAGMQTRAANTAALVQNMDARAEAFSAAAAERDQKTRAQQFKISQQASRAVWDRVKGLQPQDRQAEADRLFKTMAPALRQLGLPVDESKPVPLDKLEMLAGFNIDADNEGAFAPIPVMKDGKQVWAFANRSGQITPTDFEKPEEYATINQKSGTTLVGKVSGRRGGVYPNAREWKDGYLAENEPVPPPYVPGSPSEAVPPAGNTGVTLNFSNQADLDAWVNSYRAQRGVQQPAPQVGSPPTSTPPAAPRTNLSPERPLYPGGASDPNFIRHQRRLEEEKAAGRASGQQPYEQQNTTFSKDEEVRAAREKAVDEQRVKLAGQQEDRARRAGNILELIGADDSPKGMTLENQIRAATGSGVGAGVDAVGRFFGHSTPGAVANKDVQVTSNQMVQNVPRFEGPQSDGDRAFYLQTAGDIANPNIPAEEKIAALRRLRAIMKGYADGTRGRLSDVEPASSPQSSLTRTNKRTGEKQMFDGYQWVPMK